jgi:hypothetical protein
LRAHSLAEHTSSVSEMTAARWWKFILDVLAVISDTLPLNEAAFAVRVAFSVVESIGKSGGKCNAQSRLPRLSRGPDRLDALSRRPTYGRLSSFRCCGHRMPRLGPAQPGVRARRVRSAQGRFDFGGASH